MDSLYTDQHTAAIVALVIGEIALPIAICATHNPVPVRRAAETDATLSRYWVGGRLVVETLLDVLRFFDRCDPSLARIGELTPHHGLDIHGHQ